jgi:hypothetical protein
MPTYLYRVLADDGRPTEKVVERVFSMREVAEVIDLGNGQKARLDPKMNLPRMVAKADNEIQGQKGKSAYPYNSDAMGCAPKQIPEMQRHLASHGTHANYTPDGRLIVENRSHRERVRKALKLVDKDGYN